MPHIVNTDLERHTSPELVAIFNNMAVIFNLKPVKRFSSRRHGIDRICRLSEEYGVPYDDAVNGTINPDLHVSPPAALHKADTVTTPESSSDTRPPARRRHNRMPEDWVIKWGVNYAGQNPRRTGSRGEASFELYEDGMTVGDYLSYDAAGMNHLIWDWDKGFIKLINEESVSDPEDFRAYTRRQRAQDEE